MATTASPSPGARPAEGYPSPDPFLSTSHDPKRQRYSQFDNQLFSVYSTGSPQQTRSALEAHLAETVRRLQETSQLGTVLVQQRKELEDRLQEVAQQSDDADIGPELREKLMELEREFNDVSRESARVFLPRSRVPSAEHGEAGGSGMFASEAHPSPSKLSVPVRKQRNQAPSRVHDIKLAAEISASLLDQLREAQALLAEKEEALKEVNAEKAELELNLETLLQRLRALDENEQRYKDENWSLETQVQNLLASSKEAADREQRLNASLKAANEQKSSLETELEQLKQAHAKLSEEHHTVTKHHETELSGLRRNVTSSESERGALQKKIEELIAQNQQLAKAMAYRSRLEEHEAGQDQSSETDDDDLNHVTPDHSPPISPAKPTPRHGQLETETLRSSLQHAHRMIQNLKNNIHREKTEKFELKRMLQETRDELEARRNDPIPGSADKRRKIKAQSEILFKKPLKPTKLGDKRAPMAEVILDEPDWEDQDDQVSPSRSRGSGGSGTIRGKPAIPGGFPSNTTPNETSTDVFDTATENENSEAFETANEREGTTTETDAFHTGAETLDGETTDDLTETEAGPASRARRPSALHLSGNRDSFQSTASTSADEYDDMTIRTPVQTHHPRYRLKINRGGQRRSTQGSATTEVYPNSPPSIRESPASFRSDDSQREVVGQSLEAELSGLHDDSTDDDEMYMEGTPTRSTVVSAQSSPQALRSSAFSRSGSIQMVAPPRPLMVDSGMMTEPWAPEPQPSGLIAGAASAIGGAIAGGVGYALGKETDAEKPDATSVAGTEEDIGSDVERHTQILDSKSEEHEHEPAPVSPPQPLAFSDISAQDLEPVELVPIVVTPPALGFSPFASLETEPVEPVEPAPVVVTPPELGFSPFASLETEPVVPEPTPAAPLEFSGIVAQQLEPVAPATSRIRPDSVTIPPALMPRTARPESVQEEETSRPELSFSGISIQATEPRTPEMPEFTFSEIATQTTEPAAPQQPKLAFSEISTQTTEPAVPKQQEFAFSEISTQTTEPAAPKRPELAFSGIAAEATEPVTPQRPAFSFSEMATQTSRPSTAQQAVPGIADVEERAGVRADDEKKPEEKKAESEKSRFAFFGSMFGGNKDKPEEQHNVAEDKVQERTSRDIPSTPVTERRIPFTSVDGNARREGADIPKPAAVETTTEGTQTLLSAEEIEKILKAKAAPVLVAAAPTQSGSPVRSTFARPASPTKKTVHPMVAADPSAYRTVRRPGSSSSMRSRTDTPPPPLPADHKEILAALGQKTGANAGTQTTNLQPPRPSSSQAGSMGPPLAPASAYNNNKTPKATRPRTPSFASMSGQFQAGTTPRPRPVASRSEVSTPLSRRTSVSSFASELDQRFNIGRGPHDGFDPATTDPRMIQAITQTMIGEYLWKYTRKTGRGELSENRHRRFFWVHPYTRTLYWSDQDPASAGRTELKAKSVQIEAVQVVTDDNPMPPGLHRKSIVIVTPGRNIKFTATTGQRHETWFNALSYLLQRTAAERGDGENEDGEDVDEFNPANYDRSASRQTGRTSLSSYRTSSPHRPHLATVTRTSLASTQRATMNRTPEPQGSISGRFSSLSGRLVPSAMRGSFSSRRSRVSAQDISVYDSEAAAHDSAEDLRMVIEQQEREADRLENVRACCDGKHDVGTLGRKGGRYQHHHHHHHHDHAPPPPATTTGRRAISNAFTVGKSGASTTNHSRTNSRG